MSEMSKSSENSTISFKKKKISAKIKKIDFFFSVVIQLQKYEANSESNSRSPN